jgi:hypothetical protein
LAGVALKERWGGVEQEREEQAFGVGEVQGVL